MLAGLQSSQASFGEDPLSRLVTAVESLQVLTGYWLEASVLCTWAAHNMTAGCSLSKRSRYPGRKPQSFYNLTSELTSITSVIFCLLDVSITPTYTPGERLTQGVIIGRWGSLTSLEAAYHKE